MTLMNFSSKEQLSLDTPPDSFINLPRGSIFSGKQTHVKLDFKDKNLQNVCPQSTNMLWLTKGWARQVAIREAYLKMPLKKF